MRFVIALLTTSPLKARLLARNRETLREKLSEKGIKLLKIESRNRIAIMHVEYPHNPLPITWIIAIIAALGVMIVAYMIIKSAGEAMPDIIKAIALYGPPIVTLMAIAYVAYVLARTL